MRRKTSIPSRAPRNRQNNDGRGCSGSGFLNSLASAGLANLAALPGTMRRAATVQTEAGPVAANFLRSSPIMNFFAFSNRANRTALAM
jgi:hypothetical protein